MIIAGELQESLMIYGVFGAVDSESRVSRCFRAAGTRGRGVGWWKRVSRPDLLRRNTEVNPPSKLMAGMEEHVYQRR